MQFACAKVKATAKRLFKAKRQPKLFKVHSPACRVILLTSYHVTFRKGAP